MNKKLKAGSEEAAAVLSCMTVEHSHEATGRLELPSDQRVSAQTAYRGPTILPLEDASETTKMKMRLEAARCSADKELWKARQANQLLLADAKSAAKRTISECLVGATSQSADTAQDLATMCTRWLTAKLTQADSTAAKDLLEKAPAHMANLTDWTRAATSASSSSKKLVP